MDGLDKEMDSAQSARLSVLRNGMLQARLACSSPTTHDSSRDQEHGGVPGLANVTRPPGMLRVTAILALEAQQGARPSLSKGPGLIFRGTQLGKTSRVSGRAGKLSGRIERSALVQGKVPVKPVLAPIPEHSGEEGRVKQEDAEGVPGLGEAERGPRDREGLGIGSQERMRRQKVVVALRARHGAQGALAGATAKARAVLALPSVPAIGAQPSIPGVEAAELIAEESTMRAASIGEEKSSVEGSVSAAQEDGEGRSPNGPRRLSSAEAGVAAAVAVPSEGDEGRHDIAQAGAAAVVGAGGEGPAAAAAPPSAAGARGEGPTTDEKALLAGVLGAEKPGSLGPQNGPSEGHLAPGLAAAGGEGRQPQQAQALEKRPSTEVPVSDTASPAEEAKTSVESIATMPGPDSASPGVAAGAPSGLGLGAEGKDALRTDGTEATNDPGTGTSGPVEPSTSAEQHHTQALVPKAEPIGGPTVDESTQPANSAGKKPEPPYETPGGAGEDGAAGAEIDVASEGRRARRGVRRSGWGRVLERAGSWVGGSMAWEQGMSDWEAKEESVRGQEGSGGGAQGEEENGERAQPSGEKSMGLVVSAGHPEGIPQDSSREGSVGASLNAEQQQPAVAAAIPPLTALAQGLGRQGEGGGPNVGERKGAVALGAPPMQRLGGSVGVPVDVRRSTPEETEQRKGELRRKMEMLQQHRKKLVRVLGAVSTVPLGLLSALSLLHSPLCQALLLPKPPEQTGLDLEPPLCDSMER